MRTSIKIEAICPKCGKHHTVSRPYKWIGGEFPKFLCKKCRDAHINARLIGSGTRGGTNSLEPTRLSRGIDMETWREQQEKLNRIDGLYRIHHNVKVG